MSTLEFENAVGERYAKAAEAREPELCCPVVYRQDLLEAIPKEIIERDYGCGDPSPFVRAGDTVLDLGSGGGKLCYIASQLVGANGRVIGVDCNQAMLDLARSYQPEVAAKVGFDNVSFRAGMIQNLQLDLELYSEERRKLTADGLEAILAERALEQRLSAESPLVKSNSVDCVVSNCVLNLVQPKDRAQLFQEVLRVLKPGGRAAISDIVSDEDIPEHMQNDPTLWSGCISGAWREDQFLEEFARAGFQGMYLAKRESEPWQTVEGIEFRSVTVVAFKPDPVPCYERNQSVIYRGPFKEIQDDDGHTYVRGQKMAVCDRTFRMLQAGEYADSFFPIEPYQEVPLDQAELSNCEQRVRTAREIKGELYQLNSKQAEDCCGGDSCC
ncbi:MAG: arsenite methyltransferase [Mariniblastus sp.]|jgi:arsenite methyltransferase